MPAGDDERVERDHRDVASDLTACTVEHPRPLARVEDSVGLIEVGADESLAVPREVLDPTAPEGGAEVGRVGEKGPREERHVELSPLEDSTGSEERGRRHVYGLDVDADVAELALNDLERLGARRDSGGRDEPRRQPLAAAAIDGVIAAATARLCEQPTRVRRAPPVFGKARLVIPALGRKDHAVERGRARDEVPVHLTNERNAVDAVRQRPAYELLPQRSMAARPQPKLEMLGPETGVRVEPDPRIAAETGELALQSKSDGERARAEPVRALRRRPEEPHADPIDICCVPTPVPRVANQCQLLSAIPGSDEERSTPDRPSRLGILDRVRPGARQILAAQRVLGQHVREE